MNEKIIFLAIDTSSDACSVALGVDNAVYACHEIVPRRHADKVLGMVAHVLLEAQINLQDVTAWVLGRGPGSFTGVRLGVSVVQGLAFATGKPVIPVSSLAILAQKVIGAGASRVAVANDARMNEIYWGLFGSDEQRVAVPLGEECLLSPEWVSLPEGGDWQGVGSGFVAYREQLDTRFSWSGIEAHSLPCATEALPLAMRAWKAGQFVNAEEAQPVYLRNQVVRTGV